MSGSKSDCFFETNCVFRPRIPNRKKLFRFLWKSVYHEIQSVLSRADFVKFHTFPLKPNRNGDINIFVFNAQDFEHFHSCCPRITFSKKLKNLQFLFLFSAPIWALWTKMWSYRCRKRIRFFVKNEKKRHPNHPFFYKKIDFFLYYPRKSKNLDIWEKCRFFRFPPLNEGVSLLINTLYIRSDLWNEISFKTWNFLRKLF